MSIERVITKEQLLSHLNRFWFEMIPGLATRPYWNLIVDGINKSIRAGNSVVPSLDKVFVALNDIDLRKFRVLLIGQDPYPTLGKANGHSFSVNKGFPIRGSLENIFKEIDREYGTTYQIDRKLSGELTSWTNQGVLLFNTILTVEVGKYRSHASIGWTQFTNEIIRFLDNGYRFVTIALGRDAQNAAMLIVRNGHLKVEAGHPSPQAVTSNFIGSDCFSTCNGKLRAIHLLPIRW